MNLKPSFYALIHLVVLCIFISCKEPKIIEGPKNLTVSEGFENPLGFYDNSPTFSWQLPVSDNVSSQSSYHIVAASSPDLLPDNADLWDSKKQETDQSVWTAYDGKPLQSRQKVYWQVKYWNQDGKVSGWSTISHFELGLLKNSDWQAKWVGLPTADDKVKRYNNVLIHKIQYLRKGFELSDDIEEARLYITAKGVFDVHLNGHNVSDDVMPPGWTPYDKRIETLTYDITALIESGQNTLAVELAPGWYSGRLGWSKDLWASSASPKILCQLEMIMKDGSKKVIVSDDSWIGTTNGPIRFSEIYDGEVYDANLEMPNWTTNNFDDNTWTQVEIDPIADAVKLEPKRHMPVRQKQTLTPKNIVKKEDNSVIFDLEQNMVGVAKVKVPLKKGDTLKIRFAEMLSPDGSFYTKNYRSAHSTDYYVAAQDAIIEWSPKFTFHGFRYVELTGYDTSQEPTKDWVTGVVQYSDFEEKGTFTSSHEKLNQLQSNITWGLRGNFFDIPTDCPQRDERMGWTGDAQVFAPTSIFNADVYSFWASWLQSVRESQYDNGGIPFVVPDVLKNDKVSSGWGDAAVIIPWDLYYRTGDIKVLRENYEMMKEWVKHHEDTSTEYISFMNSFADWLQPYPDNGNTRGDTSHSLIGTAFFARSAKLTANTAKALGKFDEQAEYEALYNAVAKAFENEFFDETGKIKGVAATQTSYLLALAFDLLSDDKIENAQKNLLEKINEADDHLRTGFLGTPLLSKVLDEMGETDLMYKLLFNETYPSWFYSINQGATTIWERWNSYSKEEGFNPQRMNSLNHYAYGAIGQWMYERIAGIAPIEAGYKKIRIAPVPGTPLTSAAASLNSRYGKVSSSWKIINTEFNLDIIVPANTTATVIIQANTEKELLVNGKSLENATGVKLVNTSARSFELEVQPGDYKFISTI